MMRYSQVYLLVLIAMIVACGDEESTDPVSCDIESQKQFVLDTMSDRYLYYDQMPTISLADYANTSAVVEALKVPPDTFSSILNQRNFSRFNEQGIIEGFGLNWQPDNDGESIIVQYVYNNSPSAEAGFKRGDRIIAINGQSINSIMNDSGIQEYVSTFNIGDRVSFSGETVSSHPFERQITKDVFNTNTVLITDILPIGDTQVGYLVYTAFIKPSSESLAAAFKQFANEGISELVLDLRYNGGGRLDTAQILSSYLSGGKKTGAPVAKLINNDKHSNENTSINFLELDNAIDLDRIYVLGTENTCSASELVINALAPFIEVILIGNNTCGKPLAASSFDFCDQSLNIVVANIVNYDDEGDYFDGFTPTCNDVDDVTHALGDPEEGMLSHALYHIVNNQCKN